MPKKNVGAEQAKLEALHRILAGEKYKDVAKRLNKSTKTITRWLQECASDEEIRSRIKITKDRHAKMLGTADIRLQEILGDPRPENRQVLVQVMKSLFRTFGVWQDQPSVNIQNVTPIQFKVDGEIHEITTGNNARTTQDPRTMLQEPSENNHR